MMTKELHLRLMKYESIFRTAIDSRYYRAMDSRFAVDFINGCRELNVHINPSCPACVLSALLTVGNLYFNYKAEPVKHSNQLEIEFPLDEPKAKDNKTIKQLNKVSLRASKQSLKTNKK